MVRDEGFTPSCLCAFFNAVEAGLTMVNVLPSSETKMPLSENDLVADEEHRKICNGNVRDHCIEIFGLLSISPKWVFPSDKELMLEI